MDKKSLIALVLIGVIFLLWPVYMKKVVGVKDPVPQPATETASPVAGEIEDENPVGATEQPAVVASRPMQNKAQSVAVERYADAETITIQTDLYTGELSTVGGGTITSWRLNQYQRGLMDGEPVELIPDSAFGNLSLVSRHRGVDLENEIFTTELDSQWVEGETGYRKIRFAKHFSDGGKMEKEFLFSDQSYSVELKIRFTGLGRETIGEAYSLQWKSGLFPTEKNMKDEAIYYQAYALQGDELLKTKEKNTGFREGSTRWVAVRTKYFIMAMIAEDPLAIGARLEGEKTSIYYGGEMHNDWKKFTGQITMPYSGYGDEVSQFSIYLGPINYTLLRAQEAQLEKTMNFGMVIIKPFSIAFYHVFQFLFSILNNYGWAIIIFAILIKVVLYPLTRKSFQSMKAMQALQPKVAAMKEKYKDDPQKLNQATMELYKKEGVNPMGGCLPMLLQMPVLFALFTLFRTTIMLRQADFLMIKDLSAPDGIIGGTINVLPIIMSATMIIQQRLMNQDPKQKAMAYMMPIFMAFIFYKMSAGLNLYYLMFNLLTIAQELLVKKKK